jgi:predicted O-methyltransferase YrrM
MRKIKSKSYEYIENLSAPESENKKIARQFSESLNLEGISLSPVEANILKFFVDEIKAEKIVEIGTLTGLSALYILEGLPAQAKLWTIEKSEQHANLAQQALRSYIDQKQCHVLVGDAKDELQKLSDEGPFDLVFIDGNKAAYLDYFNWAVANLRVGGLVVADNVFLAGSVWDDSTQQKFNEKQIKTLQQMNKQAYEDKNLRSLLIPTEEGLLVCKKLSS